MHPDESHPYRIPPVTPPPPGYGPPPGYPHGYPPGYPPPYGYAVAPWQQPRPSTRWPHGPDRPGVATAAAVLGFVTGGLTALGSLIFLVATLSGEGDLATGLLALGLPCAGFLIRGGLLVLRRDGTGLLIGSALAAVAVLLLALLAGAAALDSGQDILGLLIIVVLAAPLPVVTASLAATRTVRGWVESLV